MQSEVTCARVSALRFGNLALLLLAACEPLGTTFLGRITADDGDRGSGASDGAGGVAPSGGTGGSAMLGAPTLPPDEELLAGAFRIVDPASRRTVESTSSGFPLRAFVGTSVQMWLLAPEGVGYRLEHESTGSCLDGALTLVDCQSAPLVEVLGWTSRSDDAPALFRVAIDGACLGVDGDELSIIDCSDAGPALYLEPAGWGRRAFPSEPTYLPRMALIIKGEASTMNAGLSAEIPDSGRMAASTAFTECTDLWLEALTDGTVGFDGVVFDSPRAVESVETVCSSSVPALGALDADYQEYIPAGEFDGVTVYYRLGTPDAGWSCSGLGGPGGSGLAYQAYGADDAAWLECSVEPAGAFIQAYLGIAAPFYANRGVPAPSEQLLGGAMAEYAEGEFGWHHFRRDYLLGRVIREDGTYGGLGRRAFSLGMIRALGP